MYVCPYACLRSSSAPLVSPLPIPYLFISTFYPLLFFHLLLNLFFAFFIPLHLFLSFFSPFLLLLPLYYLTLFYFIFIPFSFSRFWTESYAMPRAEVAGSDAHPAVRRLVEMGFAEEDCRQALLTHKGKCRVLSLLFLLIII